jgi:hypothetical protein
MDFNRDKCFKRGGYDLGRGKVVVQFSDQSIYEYDGLSLNDWLEWQQSYPRGSYFNLNYRYSDTHFTRLNAWPENLFFTFFET